MTTIKVNSNLDIAIMMALLSFSIFVITLSFEVDKVVKTIVQPTNKTGKYIIDLPEEIDVAKNGEILDARIVRTNNKDSILIEFRH